MLTSAIVSAIVAPALMQTRQRDPIAALKGKQLPAFTMRTTDGKTITSRQLRGRVILIDFWATWCGPCKEATPTMQALHTKYAAKGLTVIGANALEDSPGPKPAADYKAKGKYTFTFTHSNDAYHKQLGFPGVPVFIFVDRKGVVREVFNSFTPQLGRSFDGIVARLIAEKA